MSISFPDSLIPADEAARLRALHLYQIANTPPEPIFDEFVAWAAQLFSTPIAIISLVDEEHVWFKAVAGVEDLSELPRNSSLCSAAILVDVPIVTSDYSPDSCQIIKPDVALQMGLSFYAGAALRTPDGSRIGMMAVIGKENRVLSETEEEVLNQLSILVSRTIELRFKYLQAEHNADWEAAQRELSVTLDDNATLTRYLMARNNGLNLNDPDIHSLVLARMVGMTKVLDRRMGETNAL
ncbi:GAF domain-containing protein [Hymenobacter terrestris]|uniref:GAF domain-containing protein n=1 Tax=Hymenobacter terrestris TaxID=2748310 RepID=A0ABX2Q0K5_9BACT|nr:GAF domain-containing protein [Hymenobacter terrestris]NVO84069.1 GAF domain-containing protein [Hymenobacter terrestris]